jgi:ankyrin repeat protein
VSATPGPPPDLDDTRVGVFLRAVGIGEHAVVEAMLASVPALVNAVGPHPFWGGRPQPLHVAIESGRPEMIDRLLEAGADVSGTNDAYDHWSPLMLALHRRRDDVRDELLRRGAHVGLAEALLLGDDARVEAMLGAAPLPEIVPNGGSFVAFARTPRAIDCLIAAGASPTQTDRWGTTPLAGFSRLGALGVDLVRRLAAHGVNAGPVELARIGDRGALDRLAGRDPAAVAGDDVVMAAVQGGHHELVVWLLDRGANPNARAHDRSRQTLLHEAAWLGDVVMVDLLLARGADPRARDDEHKATARDWAETSVTVTNNPRCADVVAWFDRRANH